MAWLIGLAKEPEITELESRGWDVERLTYNELRHLSVSLGGTIDETELPDADDDNVWVRLFVDNDLFKIASGPDWEQGNSS